jgi:hypothetical protein
LVNDGHSADAMCPHVLYCLEDALVLTDHNYFAADQITCSDCGRIELRRDHTDNDVSVGNQTYRNALSLGFINYHQVAHMIPAHQLSCFEYASGSIADDYFSNADFSDRHNPLPVVSVSLS